jgi:hypothetical protein
MRKRFAKTFCCLIIDIQQIIGFSYGHYIKLKTFTVPSLIGSQFLLAKMQKISIPNQKNDDFVAIFIENIVKNLHFWVCFYCKIGHFQKSFQHFTFSLLSCCPPVFGLPLAAVLLTPLYICFSEGWEFIFLGGFLVFLLLVLFFIFQFWHGFCYGCYLFDVQLLVFIIRF